MHMCVLPLDNTALLWTEEEATTCNMRVTVWKQVWPITERAFKVCKNQLVQQAGERAVV